MGDYRKLKVWEKAHAMALCACRVSAKIKSGPYSCVRNQMIRAALSVPTNIVEGAAQQSVREFNRFVRYSINSANETEYHCFVARDLGLIRGEDHKLLEGQLEEVRRMLYGLQRGLRGKPDS